MKLWKTLVIVLVILLNFALAQPSLADKPKFFKNPDYIEITKTLNDLLATKDKQIQSGQATAEEIQQKIERLEFQKYTLETGVNWGQCTNQTGKTLAVYGPKPDLDDDDDDYVHPYENGLYFLADGQTTKDKWDCDGVYLPSGTQIASLTKEKPTSTSESKPPVDEVKEPAGFYQRPSTGVQEPGGFYQKKPSEEKTSLSEMIRQAKAAKQTTESLRKQNQESENPLALKNKNLDETKLTESPKKQNQGLENPVALKIVDGTKLVVKTNPDTGTVEFNIPAVKFIQAGEANWFIPNVSQADIDTRVPNAKTAKS